MAGKNLYRQETLAALIDEWQGTGAGHAFARLWAAGALIVFRAARATLAKSNVRDPGAIDDVVSLVADHLRRLPGGKVAKFDSSQSAENYLWWLATRRAVDVVRSCRRQREKPRCDGLDIAVSPAEANETDSPAGSETQLDVLREAMASLDSRSQEVIKRHLLGERQSQTAREIGVCEGTVTRIRQRALARLREALKCRNGG